MCDLTIYDLVDDLVDYIMNTYDEKEAEAMQAAQNAQNAYAGDECLRKYLKEAFIKLAEQSYDIGDSDDGGSMTALRAAHEYIVVLRQITYSNDVDTRKEAWSKVDSKGQAWDRWRRIKGLDK